MRVLGIDPGIAQTGWAVLETGLHPSTSGLVPFQLDDLRGLPEQGTRQAPRTEKAGHPAPFQRVGTGLAGSGRLQQVGTVLVASGLLKTFPKQSLPQRLAYLHASLGTLLSEYKPETLAIEELFFMKAARSVAATSYARAVILLAAAQATCPVAEYNPRTVKTSLTGNGNAPKPQMQKMVQALLSLDRPPQPDDVADAMAIGLCHLKYARFQKAVIVSGVRGVQGVSRVAESRVADVPHSRYSKTQNP